jgi:CRISPR-associated protein Csb2
MTVAMASVSNREQVGATSHGVAAMFRFPGKRYHATPWGHHVNEGLIEWPPSPWRLLRSFVATGYAKLHWAKEGPPALARSLLERLAAVLPNYRLPDGVGAHSRHYMPLARLENGREKTTMVLDTWAQIDNGAIGVHWNVELTPDERSLLGDIVRELGYLGRSESWVEGSLVGHFDALEFDVRPGEVRERPGMEWEQVSLLAALSEGDYLSWRERALQTALDALPTADAKGKPLSKARQTRQREEVEASYPADLVKCLHVDTRWLRELGWSQPPGSRKVFYWRPLRSLQGAGAQVRPRAYLSPTVEFMLLSMATATGNMHGLPSVTRTLPQGELLHRALLSRGREATTRLSVLSGRDADGKPLRNEVGHRHAHLLHLDLDGDGHLDHVLLWAPMGLNAEAQRVVRAVRTTFTKGGTAPLRLALAASGDRSELMSLPSPWGDRLREVLGGSSNGAKHWRSTTPFVPPRFVKPRGRNSIEGQLAAELEARGFPRPTSIRCIDPHDADALVRKSRHFVRRRRREQCAPPVDSGFVVELAFSEPIRGPIAVGYGSHFGLGLFSAM